MAEPSLHTVNAYKQPVYCIEMQYNVGEKRRAIRFSGDGNLENAKVAAMEDGCTDDISQLTMANVDKTARSFVTKAPTEFGAQ